MRNSRGFTLIEVMVAMVITLISILGFLAGAATTVSQRNKLAKIQEANAIAVDVADSLARLTKDSTLIQPTSGNQKYVGYDGSGNLMKCAAGSLTGNAPTFDTDGSGTTEYSNPWNSSSNLLYMYDNNIGTFTSAVNINTSANAFIDHPNSTDLSSATTLNQIVKPIRQAASGTTYYVVWSVAYMPCTTTSADKVNIFVTVYWIDPEPTETSVSAVQSKLVSKDYKLKKLSFSFDRAYKIED